jgi:integrase
MQAKLLADMVRVMTTQAPPEKELTVFDTVLPRFALRVRPPAKPDKPWPSVYFIRWEGAGRRERKLTIGSPATMNLDEARRVARRKLALVDAGGDPQDDRRAQREVWTVQALVDAYLASSEFRRKTPKGQATEGATARLHIAHHLGKLTLDQIDVPHVKRMLRAIEGDARVNSRRRRLGGVGAARKSARLLSAMLSWCVDHGRLARNPLIGSLRLPSDGVRETVLTESSQYAALFKAADDLTAEGDLRPAARAFIVVAALTGMRRSELQALKWGNVDLAERRVTIVHSKAAKLVRGGPKIERVSLPPYAAATLAAIRPEDAEDDEQVFVPRRGEHMEVNRDWRRLRERAGLPGDLALHGLRHSAGTVAVLAGMSGPEVQKMLRHRNITTTARYIHLADSARLQDRAMKGMAPAVPAHAEKPAAT